MTVLDRLDTFQREKEEGLQAIFVPAGSDRIDNLIEIQIAEEAGA